MGVNKVVFNTAEGEQTLIDLTNDTVTPETLAMGETAHDKSGTIIIGTMRSGEDLDAALTAQDSLIAELKATLRGKASGSDSPVDDRYDEGYADGLAARTYETWTITYVDGTSEEMKVATI